MPWIGGLIAGGAGLLGASMQADAAEGASAAQAAATREANALQKQQYETTRGDLAPFRQYGVGAVNMLAQKLGIPSGGAGGAMSESRDSIRTRLMPQYQTGTTALDSAIAELQQGGALPQVIEAYGGIENLARARLAGQGVDPASLQGAMVDESALSAAIDAEMAKQAQAAAAQEASPDFGSLLKSFTGADLVNEPGYQFGLQQGQQALDRKAQAGGGFYSGAALKAASRYGQDYAGTKYGDAFNRDAATKNQQYNFLSGGASLGQNAAAMTGNAGTNMANQVGANTTALGNAYGASSIAQGNAWSGALNNGVNAYSQNALIDRILGGNRGWGSGGGWQGGGRTVPDYPGAEY